MKSIFPFTVYDGHFGHKDLRMLFLNNRHKDVSWFEFDTIFEDSTKVKFHVYDMDNRTGYRGGFLYTTETVIINPNDFTEHFLRRAREVARNERVIELQAIEDSIIAGKAAVILQHSLQETA